MKKRISAILVALVSLFFAIAINTFFGPCDGMMAMKCKTTTNVATVVFILTLAVSVISLCFKSSSVRKCTSIVEALLGIGLLFVPFIGRCGSEMMRCNEYTMPAIRIGGAVILVIAAINTIILFVKKEVTDNENK